MNLDKRLLILLTTARGMFGLTIALGVLSGILVVAQADRLSHVVARVLTAGDRLDDVWPALLALLVIMLGRAGVNWVSEIAAFRMAARVKQDLRRRVLEHLYALGPGYVRGERTGELMNTAMEGIEQLEPYFSQYLPQLFLAVLVPLLILAFVVPVDLLSALVLLITGPLIPLFMVLIGKAADALTRRQWQSLSLMSAHLLDVLQGLVTLKLFGKSREESERIRRVSEGYRDATLRVLRVAFLSAFALEMIATICTAIIAVQVGLRLLYGQMEFEPAFFVLVLAPDFYLPLRLLGTRFHAGITGVAAADRIFEILQLPTPSGQERAGPGVVATRPACSSRAAKQHPTPTSLPETLVHPIPEITFNNVHYTYPDGRRGLDGISFELQPGQRTALVGPTGAGKSTVLSLLLRFYDAQQGEICCNLTPIDAWSLHEWRARLAWVPQHPYLFDDTIAANIRLARPEADMDAVLRAARLAQADEFIRALPERYDTRIGERGARLSGGEAQRIALARAFLKDAPLLVLDEATANLDVENALAVQAALDALMAQRTVLMISHRLSTISRAHQILVMDRGRVVERGTHEQLVDHAGLYRRLVASALGEAE